ncbi:hypothetical protein B0A49_06081, partial [Cryomyces minteri]
MEMQSTTGDAIKEQVLDWVPKRIKELQFGILSNQDIVKQAVVEISDRNVYDLGSHGPVRALTKNGPMDGRMGTSTKGAICDTCGEDLTACIGHFGHVKLALPAFHIGYFKKIIEILHDICKKISAECKKCKKCPYCGTINGAVKKVPGHPLKIIHEKYRAFNTSTAKSKVAPPCKVEFDRSFEEAKKGNPELEKHVKKAVDDMNPLRVLNLFRRIAATDCELLGMNPADGRPEMFIWQYVPAPPVCIRPSVAQEAATTEDDITNKLGDIIQISSLIRAGLDRGQPVQTIMEQWDFLQLQIAMYIDGSVPGLQQPGFGRPVRGFCQRLKGKQGRFRGNLSGKRVDFSARTVISPDPNLGIDEVAVPLKVALNLTYPERVSRYNLKKLQDCVRRGSKKHPGANRIIKKDTGNMVLISILERYNRQGELADQLNIGDVVDRHLEDGDIVLFNRQPSLHKLSILSHKAKIRPWRTFRLNECVCNPYNADFDGDEMNLHVPQTEEARTEAIELMGVKHNIATPKNGTPIIAAIQDFITAAFLSSNKSVFYDRKTFAHICGYMFNDDSIVDPETGERMSIELPEPAIWKPQRLWTGKQIWNVLMRPNKKSKVLVNLDAGCKQFKPTPGQPNDLDEDDQYLVIRNSEVMCGVMDKNTVGDGKKDSVFYVIMRDFGPDYAVQAMNRLAKLSARWLTNQGFSIGISDVYPSDDLVRRKQALIDEAYRECDQIIDQYNNGRLEPMAGCDEETTMENKLSGLLSAVRGAAAKVCFEQLSKWNSPLIMAKSGSKGSNNNVSQMVASVGQQIIGGKRVLEGFQDRTLPHFPKGGKMPAAKGFVKNSFFSGLSPTEFIFHAMSGREGLVDTAVKTAETGYMSRRLMKSLEDLSAHYDNTVRTSSSGLVQFQYGDDNLDPVDMEGNAKPVHFDRAFVHAVTTTWDNEESGLPPFEIVKRTRRKLQVERNKWNRLSLMNEPLAYKDKSDHGIDQFESRRDFLDTIEAFIMVKVNKLGDLRERVRMLRGDQDNDQMDWEVADDVKQRSIVNGVAKISRRALEMFIGLCLEKYEKSKVQPGHAVGAVGAQSIGEPGTQMTLKTFHFAGVAGMSITQGVPRIKEIINASKVISTPVITCVLAGKGGETAARIVKSRIEKTYLRDIIVYIEDVWYKDGSYLNMRVDLEAVRRLQLEVSLSDISKAIVKTKGLKLGFNDIRTFGTNHIRVYPAENDDTKPRRANSKAPEDFFERMQNLKRNLPNVVVKGYPDATRAVIQKADKKNAQGEEEIKVLVEGYGLKLCMTTDGINGCRT